VEVEYHKNYSYKENQETELRESKNSVFINGFSNNKKSTNDLRSPSGAEQIPPKKTMAMKSRTPTRIHRTNLVEFPPLCNHHSLIPSSGHEIIPSRLYLDELACLDWFLPFFICCCCCSGSLAINKISKASTLDFSAAFSLFRVLFRRSRCEMYSVALERTVAYVRSLSACYPYLVIGSEICTEPR
jgi:hypothetical protein